MVNRNKLRRIIHLAFLQATIPARRNREIAEALAILERAEIWILQQEKMPAFRHLASSVARDFNNPLSYILGNLEGLAKYFIALTAFANMMEAENEKQGQCEDVLLEKKAPGISCIEEDSQGLITETLEGALRIKEIIRNLLVFPGCQAAQESPTSTMAYSVQSRYSETKSRKKRVSMRASAHCRPPFATLVN